MNFLAAKLIELRIDILIFSAIIFLIGICCLIVFSIKKVKYLLKKNNTSNDKDNEDYDYNENPIETEVENKEIEIETLEKFKVIDMKIITPEEKIEEENTKTVEGIRKTWENNDVKRTTMIDMLKTAGVKGISKLSKADLREKCIEMGFICPIE